MATLYAAADQSIVAFLPGLAEEATDAGPPTGAVSHLYFDERTNAALVASLKTTTAGYTLIGGTLSHNGAPVPIHPPTDRATERAALAPLVAALQAGTATPAQVQAALAFLLRAHLRS